MTYLAAVFGVSALFLSQSEVPHIRAAQAAYEEGKQAEAGKQFPHAVECLRKAIEIEPTFLEARKALIATYLESGQELKGAAAITELLEIKPDALKYRLMLGSILLRQRQSQKALAQYSMVLSRDPDNADGLLGFATAASQVGMKDRANAAMERGRAHYPQDPRFRNPPGSAQK